MMFGYLIPDKPEDVKLAEKRDKVTIEELADDEDPHPWDSFQENAKAHREMKFRMAQVRDCQSGLGGRYISRLVSRLAHRLSGRVPPLACTGFEFVTDCMMPFLPSLSRPILTGISASRLCLGFDAIGILAFATDCTVND